MLQVRLVPVAIAGAGAWPVYESATGIPVIQMQSNPGAVPVYVGARGYGVPVRFSTTPTIPVTPPTPPVTTDTRVTDAGDDRVTSDGDTRAIT